MQRPCALCISRFEVTFGKSISTYLSSKHVDVSSTIISKIAIVTTSLGNGTLSVNVLKCCPPGGDIFSFLRSLVIDSVILVTAKFGSTVSDITSAEWDDAGSMVFQNDFRTL